MQPYKISGDSNKSDYHNPGLFYEINTSLDRCEGKTSAGETINSKEREEYGQYIGGERRAQAGSTHW